MHDEMVSVRLVQGRGGPYGAKQVKVRRLRVESLVLRLAEPLGRDRAALEFTGPRRRLKDEPQPNLAKEAPCSS